MIAGLIFFTGGKEEKADIQQPGPGSAAPMPSPTDEPEPGHHQEIEKAAPTSPSPSPTDQQPAEPGHQEIDWFSLPMLLIGVILAAFAGYVEALWT